MSEHLTPRFNFSYYDRLDDPWEDGMNKNILVILDKLLIGAWGYNARADVPGEVGYYGGMAVVADVYAMVTGGTIVVTSSVVNYIERDSEGVVYATLTAFSPPEDGRIPMFAVTVDGGGVVTAMEDWRTPGVGGGGTTGGLGVRVSVPFTTGSLAFSAYEEGVVDIGTGYAELVSIDSGGGACRVRLYTTSASRLADTARGITVDAIPGTGTLAEFIFLSGSGVINCSPVPALSNNDGPVDTIIYYRVDGMEAASTAFTITLTILPLEST